MKHASVAAVAIAVATLLTGCGTDVGPASEPTVPVSTSSGPVPADTSGDFTERLEAARADAVKDGASDAQLAIIDEAVTTGGITMEQLLVARDNYAQCLEAVGYTLHDLGVSDDNGYPYPDYSVEIPTSGENQALMDDCESTHFLHVDYLYQMQPSSQQAQENDFAAAMPKLIECLNDGGVDVPADTTADELKRLMLDEIKAQYESDPDDPFGSPVHTCLDQVGINGF